MSLIVLQRSLAFKLNKSVPGTTTFFSFLCFLALCFSFSFFFCFFSCGDHAGGTSPDEERNNVKLDVNIKGSQASKKNLDEREKVIKLKFLHLYITTYHI